jgi:hypothetical protein
MVDIGDKIPITFRALCQRLNRHLFKQSVLLKKSRTQDGPYFLVNLHTNGVKRIAAKKLEAYARKKDVLKPYEKIE